jgi:hypothetical protein
MFAIYSRAKFALNESIRAEKSAQQFVEQLVFEEYHLEYNAV